MPYRLDIDGQRRLYEARLITLRVVIDELLPSDVSADTEALAKMAPRQAAPLQDQNDRKSILDLCAHIVADVERDLLAGSKPLELPSMSHRLFQQSAEEVGMLAKHLKDFDLALEHAMPITKNYVADELQKRGIDVNTASNVFNALIDITQEGSRPLPPMRRGNRKTAIGVYTLSLWRMLNALGLQEMRPASRIVAGLLIATIHQHKDKDHQKLAESCYQTIRNAASR